MDVMRECECGAAITNGRACHCDLCEGPLPADSPNPWLHEACAAELNSRAADALARVQAAAARGDA